MVLVQVNGTHGNARERALYADPAFGNEETLPIYVILEPDGSVVSRQGFSDYDTLLDWIRANAGAPGPD